MYNYPYPTPYTAQYQGSFNQSLQLPPPRQEIVKVNGKNGAEAYQLGINSSVLLLDETAPIVWLKTTDGGGYPTVTPYSITPYQPEPPVDIKSIESRIKRLEDMLDESHFSTIKPTENAPADTAVKTNTASSQRNAKSSSGT